MKKHTEKEYLDKLRHSTAHLLASAVVELYPGVKRTIGPAIENGFYYDFDFGENKLSAEDLPEIEKKMTEIVKTWNKFTQNKVAEDEARLKIDDNKYKLELLEEIISSHQEITFYKSGSFEDLCRGGHIENPSLELQYFKLLTVAGAYWRGDEKNKMLTRIYGTVFPSQKELEAYLQSQEEARKRDHRKLGKELDLFSFSSLVGSGLPLYSPKGSLIRGLLTNFVEELQTKQGYQQVWTPQIGKAELFKVSGHYDKYKKDMFKVISNYSDDEFYLKPMNCPQHTQIYASNPRSYRDLPLRYADFAMLYRDERPGELNGLARVRAFSQDDCHIFCREDQVDQEIDVALAMTKQIMATFGFKYRYRLSTRDPKQPEKYLGDPKTWDKVENWAEKIMIRNNIDHYDGPGEAAFYAPKMDLMATDALGREWQLSTVQIDYVQPARFALTYTDKDGNPKTPVMLHRAIIGSPERLMMILIEHFAGAFPTWLSPVQVKLLPITDQQNDYARKTAQLLRDNQIRVEIDNRSERLQAKIRDAQMEKVPYMLIIGKKEVEDKKISVRTRNEDDLGAMQTDKFIKKILHEITSKSLKLMPNNTE